MEKIIITIIDRSEEGLMPLINIKNDYKNELTFITNPENLDNSIIEIYKYFIESSCH